MTRTPGAPARGFGLSLQAHLGALSLVLLAGAGIFTSTKAMADVTGTTSWAVLRCQLKDTPVPVFTGPYAKDPEQFYADFFAEAGKGKNGLYDYWHDISNGTISLNGTKILPWVPLDVTVSADPKRDRTHQVQDCVNAVEDYIADKKLTGKEYDLSSYYGLFIIQNAPGGEFGSIQNVTIGGKTLLRGVVFFEFGSLDISHASHEMGHGYGLDHAFDMAYKKGCGGGGPGEYCDFWDPLGNPFWSVTTYFNNPNFGTATCCGSAAQPSEQYDAGPGLNAVHLDELGWIPKGRKFTYNAPELGKECTKKTVTLAALGHPGADGYPKGLVPSGGTPDFYPIQHRNAAAWDRSTPDTILIHTPQLKFGGTPST